MKNDTTGFILALILTGAAPVAAGAQQQTQPGDMPMISKGIILPQMDAAEGRRLFAAKGCVVCHSVNGIGGSEAPALDADYMEQMMNPFDFAASMWRGAETMVELQREELGSQIELTEQELADITAFVHDAEEQKRFTKADIPPEIAALMMKMGGGE